MFDPNNLPERCERYLSHHLGEPVRFIKAEQLAQSSRQAPWRLDTHLHGLERSFILQVDTHNMEHEYRVLQAMQDIPVPTPYAYGLDLDGTMLGIPCFFEDFIPGEPLLEPVLKGESWAEELFIDTVCALNAVTDEQLGEIADTLERYNVRDILEETYSRLKDKTLPLVERMYRALKDQLPEQLPVKFSNGDLWLENFIVQDHHLAGVIDFAGASFTDPLYEFLLSFFVSPELHGRGLEERYCQRIGCDPAILAWYHGLEFFETYRYVLLSGKDFVHHSVHSLEADMAIWLDSPA
jgi:aminoglycoside phosphotransferase (APT) family kinase protein